MNPSAVMNLGQKAIATVSKCKPGLNDLKCSGHYVVDDEINRGVTEG